MQGGPSKAETSRIVFSWNDNKPTVIKNSDGTVSYSFERHQQQGSTSINLLGGLPNPPEIPSDANSFIVGVEKVCAKELNERLHE